MKHWLLVAIALTVAPCSLGAEQEVPRAPAPPSAEQADLFERSVRPVLVERCQSCHGADEQEAGLRLDSATAALQGSAAGPVIMPGEPDKSRLIHAISYEGEVQMPPDGKLPAEQIEALTTWIKLGAFWPSEAPAQPATNSAGPVADRLHEARSTYWSLQPIHKPPLPDVRDKSWPQDELDYFILAELERAGLSPSPPASRAALIRRMTFDLIGLPPTREEVVAFEEDASPDALAKVVDRLLASPQYGQRWGRHWLDVARYADTKGYVFTEDTRYPYSYTYRDYVIRAFNEDLPFDRFVLEQLAADQLDLGGDQRPLAALGFLTVGSRFMHNIHDILDDRIDVATRGLMGLTVTCARCHDHKYDPITQADYYALYGVFASSPEPGELPLVARPEENEAYLAHRQELDQRQKAHDDFLAAQVEQIRSGLRARVADYLVEVVSKKEAAIPDGAMLSLQPDELKPAAIERWRTYLAETAKSHHPVFSPWHALSGLPPETFAADAAPLVATLATEPAEGGPAPVNRLVKESLVKGPLASMVDVARAYGELLAGIEGAWRETLRVATSTGGELPPGLADPAAEELRQVLYAEGTPTAITADDIHKQYDFLLDRTMANEYNRLRRELDACKANSPAEPPRAMAVADAPQPVEPHIFIRGNPNRPGESVPRRFLALLSEGEPQPFTKGSGRLELAQHIVSPNNPLTARVLVNRVWMHHFGAPLVATPSDFGSRSDPPTHPALLDYLAATFRDEGWSLKKLHRRLLLSSTYQQASQHRPEAAQRDPENRLYWRMNRRRLEFEAVRDSLLAVAGRLDTSLDGRPVNLQSQPFATRRAVYGFIDRGDLPGVFRAFDFASPESSSPGRPRTTVPQQALFLLNSVFVIEQARHVAARPEVANQMEPSSRVRALYNVVLARQPDPEEVHWALEFIESAWPPAQAGAESMSAWEQLAQVLLETNEFMFID
jgi:cytochrome c553